MKQPKCKHLFACCPRKWKHICMLSKAGGNISVKNIFILSKRKMENNVFAQIYLHVVQKEDGKYT